MITDVALGRAGIVLGLEVSRLARNNADWYRLIELCSVTDTLLGDNDGLYHPALFNDRLILGVKGTMSEMELHVIRARLDGGIRNKAARGELERGLPVGMVWGERDGEVRLDPDRFGNASATCRRSSGKCCWSSITLASSIGQCSRRISRSWMAMLTRCAMKQVVEQ